MSRISRLEISWNGLLASISLRIANWTPSLQPREIAYSDLLAIYLRDCLPTDAQIEREYRHLGETLDLYVRCSGLFMDDEILIEVKHRLSDKPELHRLIGQISTLQPDKNKIMVVLIGQCDIELVGRFRRRFVNYLQATGPETPSMSLLEIPEARQ